MGVAVAAVLLAGACSAGRERATTTGPETASIAPPTAPAVESTTTAPPPPEPTSTTTTAPPPPPPEVPLADGRLEPGETGQDVVLLQLRLAELGYRPGPADGSYGGATSSAVLAFQKREGLGRDGIAGPEVLDRLGAPQGAGPRDPGGGRHLEIDLDRQIGFFVADDGAVTTINVSTGNGASYVNPKTRVRSVAVTPTGSFRVYRRIDGTEKAPLGTLYRPAYFKGGWAVHGSTSVPAYPASHGCVRTSYADQDWLFPQLPIGTPVVVYRGPPPAAADAPPAEEPLPANAAPGE